MSPYRERYHRDLKELKNLTKELADRGGGAIDKSVLALRDANVDLAREVIKQDQEMDDLGLKIENLCMELLALQQPMAKDLRRIIGILKICIDLERIGDESAKIGRACKWLSEKGSGFRMNRIPDLHQTAEIAARLLHRSLDAFARLDGQAAAAIIRDDAGIDDRFRATLRQLVTYMMEDPRSISAAIDTIWVAKAIERVGDHAKNIAEHVIFIAHGTDVRHASLEDVDRVVSQG